MRAWVREKQKSTEKKEKYMYRYMNNYTNEKWLIMRPVSRFVQGAPVIFETTSKKTRQLN